MNTKNGANDIILASDPRLPSKRPGRGNGAFHATTFPVYVPTAHRLLESYLRGIARGRDGQHEDFFLAMVTYIEEYVDGDGLLDKKRLEGRCREFYQGFINFSKPTIVLLNELSVAFSPSTATKLQC